MHRLNTKALLKSGLPLFCLFFCFLLVFIFSNWRLKKSHLPNYATWSGGLRDLEFKIHQLEELGAAYPIDTVFLGCSIQDSGMSAEAFSQELPKLGITGSAAYNFALPAMGIDFWPAIYQLMKLSIKPKRIFIGLSVNYGQSRDTNRIEKLSHPKALPTIGKKTFFLNAFDYFSQSPAAQLVANPLLLKLSRKIWKIPVLEKAGAVKDKLVFGSFVNIQASQAESVPRSAFGDGLAYSFNPDLKAIQDWTGMYKKGVRQTVNCIKESRSDEEKKLCFFSDTDLPIVLDFLALSKKDGIEVIFAAHDLSAGLTPRIQKDPQFQEDRRFWFKEFERVFAVSVINFLDDFVIEPFELADGVHLNSFGGTRYGKLLAQSWASRKDSTLSQKREISDPKKIPFYYKYENAEQDSPLTNEQLSQGKGFIIVKGESSIGSALEITFFQKSALTVGQTYIVEFCTPDRKVLHILGVVARPGILQIKTPFLPHEKLALISRVVVKNDKTGEYGVPFRLFVERFKWTASFDTL